MRKLASIQQINRVETIENADSIERVRILGWWVVAKKGEFRPGDRVIYCEVDSFLPERAEFEFLRSQAFKPAIWEADQLIRPSGFRIKTVKLRGQISQGICFPLSLLSDPDRFNEGDDVSLELGIQKYEPPIPVGMGGKVKGDFPGFLSKTDETRVQVLEPILMKHRGKRFNITEKLDGTSFTAFFRQGEFGICSRNQWLDEADESNLLCRLTRRLDLPEKLRLIQNRFEIEPAIQGEVIGPGIQGNKYAVKHPELWIFNLIDLSNGRLVDRDMMIEILQDSNLNIVPQLGELILEHSVDDLVQLSVGISALNSRIQREGIILRPLQEEFESELGGRLSFKVINPLFLLRFDE